MSHQPALYQLAFHPGRPIIEVVSAGVPLGSERAALELVALSWQEHTDLLMLQKFSNYQLRVAVVCPDRHSLGARFGKLVSESNRGRVSDVFGSREAAHTWLLT